MAKLNGPQALDELDKFLGKARDMLRSVDRQFNSARDALAKVQYEQVGIYTQLAKLRLLEIEQGELVAELDRADREASEILESRKTASKQLEDRIETAEDELQALEQERVDQQALVGRASEALDLAESRAQAALESDAAYQAQLKRTEETDFIADQAEEKAAAAESDRREKGEPYETDRLFAYLWRRGYGTSSYRALPVTRWLDGKVARLCGFESARRNYSVLIEIPPRLKEHAATMRSQFEREAGALADLEEQAAVMEQVPERAADLDLAVTRLDALDETIAAKEDEIRTLVAARNSFATGKDEHYQQCIEVLRQAMEGKGIALLEERAARTPNPDDDRLVQRLASLRRESERIDQDLVDFSRLHRLEDERVNDIQELRRKFKSARFDDNLSEFKDWALIALVLNQFLGGSARAGDIWKTIKRQQRTRPVHADPDFGTLRFPRGRHGPWRMPKGGFGGGGFKTGGGFRGGGGFKTGGGFRGGGGFKTGGGF